MTTNNSTVSSIAIKNSISDCDLSWSVNVCVIDNLISEIVYCMSDRRSCSMLIATVVIDDEEVVIGSSMMGCPLCLVKCCAPSDFKAWMKRGDILFVLLMLSFDCNEMFDSICIVIYETNYVSSREPPPLLTTNGNADTNNLTPEEDYYVNNSFSVIAWLY